MTARTELGLLPGVSEIEANRIHGVDDRLSIRIGHRWEHGFITDQVIHVSLEEAEALMRQIEEALKRR